MQPGFYKLEELPEENGDFKKTTWSIGVLNVGEIEIEQFFSNESWENVLNFAKELLGKDFSGEIARQIQIFGDPKNASEIHREYFLPSPKPWRSKFHFPVL